uniref:lysozyme inhibitor LprI family protein n=1 Tax=Paracoccus sp. TRP TaxID=412597 RepID=UPI000225FAAE|nr:lysozyme inhibitor LprI family protein [Paracoccus sp. TRP]
MCKLVPPLVAALIAFAAPAMAEDGPRYDAGGFARCIADAKAGTDIDAALNNCIGVASTQCMATPGGDTTVGMSQCLESETRDWDKLLNINYARALKVAEAADKELAELGSAASPAAPELRKAQRNWIAFRDSTCRYEVLRFQGGTAGGPAAQSCMLELTADQALRLGRLTEGMEEQE